MPAGPVHLACLLGRPTRPPHKYHMVIRGHSDGTHTNGVAHVGKGVPAAGVGDGLVNEVGGVGGVVSADEVAVVGQAQFEA